MPTSRWATSDNFITTSLPSRHAASTPQQEAQRKLPGATCAARQRWPRSAAAVLAARNLDAATWAETCGTSTVASTYHRREERGGRTDMCWDGAVAAMNAWRCWPSCRLTTSKLQQQTHRTNIRSNSSFCFSPAAGEYPRRQYSGFDTTTCLPHQRPPPRKTAPSTGVAETPGG